MTLRVHPDEIVARSSSDLLAVHSSWTRVRLSDVAEVQNGFAFKSAQFNREEGIPLLRIRDVGRETTETRFSGDFDPAYLVEPGAIVVGMDGDFRAARWAGEPALLNQRVCRIRVRRPDFYDASFLLHTLPGYLAAINAATSSVTVKHLSSRTVEQIPLPLPPLSEQRRIVAAIEEQFSRLDAATDSILSAAARIPILEGQVVDAAVNGWARRPLTELLSEPLRNGHSSKAASGGAIRTLTLTAVTQAQFTDENTKLTSADPSKVEGLWLEAGDVLIERSNTPELVGTAAMYRGPNRWAIFPDLMIRVRVNDEILPEFLELVLKSSIARSYFRSAAQGIAGTMPKIDQRCVARLPVPVPQLDQQRRILSEVDERLTLTTAVRLANESAQRRTAILRRSILERAFRGGLVPQDPSDEPAAALSQRIQAEHPARALARRTRQRRGFAATT